MLVSIECLNTYPMRQCLNIDNSQSIDNLKILIITLSKWYGMINHEFQTEGLPLQENISNFMNDMPAWLRGSPKISRIPELRFRW